MKVGVIGIPSPDYDAKRWWRYSDGVREVIGESIAYVYAKVFFRPSESMREKKAVAASHANGKNSGWSDKDVRDLVCLWFI